MSNQRNTLLKFLIAILLAAVTSALPADDGLLQNTGVHLGCTENCNNYNKAVLESTGNSTEYSPNAGSALSITTGMGFMAMFLWTLLSLL